MIDVLRTYQVRFARERRDWSNLLVPGLRHAVPESDDFDPLHRLRSSGENPCGPRYVQIGGHTRSEGLILVTNNLREFARMPGVSAESWV